MRVLEMFHRTLILTILLILTTPLSWAASWPIEERAAMCDVGIIETMDRLNGQPHDRDECIRDPDAYLTKIMAIITLTQQTAQDKMPYHRRSAGHGEERTQQQSLSRRGESPQVA